MVGRIETALRSKNFTLAKLNNELQSMAMIRALPFKYEGFVSALMLKDTLDKAIILSAFQNEEILCAGRISSALSTAMHTGSVPSTSSSMSAPLSLFSTAAAALIALLCDFCGRSGHTIHKCFKFAKAKKDVQDAAAAQKKARSGSGRTNQTSGSSQTSQDPSAVQKFAGSASLRSSDPSSLLSPLILNADIRWNAHRGHFSYDPPPSLVP